jgi:hypothetical protein
MKKYYIPIVIFMSAILFCMGGIHPAKTDPSSDKTFHIIGCAASFGSDSSNVHMNALGEPVDFPFNPTVAEAMHEDADALRNAYGVDAVGVFVQERGSPNACATSTVVTDDDVGAPVGYHPDGTVFFGVKLIGEEIDAENGYGWAIPAIEAHEFAHILQYKRHFPLEGTKWCELHADFMAGWFMAWRIFHAPTNAVPGMDSFNKMGDNDFTNPQHHGTPAARTAAYKAGFDCLPTNPTASQAYDAGIAYLQTLDAPIPN